ncbi:28S ribosomal protein S21, mitochondrial-like isoform X3 [Portunus trituberculatus]|uniref:28S ribosomal protein S21, mitochondrial-like isoform X3 n=1 Tax=Portunus trituberculatus TaxID=210409 RepID=UPI001E1D0263|nr:28S ribosomal protein S21, mitochondrial-like isoform X3 [Portunus trituberculatus]
MLMKACVSSTDLDLMQFSVLSLQSLYTKRIMSKEGLFERYRLTRFYEKPYQTRRRINYEKAKAIYNEDMNRKIQFVMRKNRHDPWVGCA